MGSFLPWFEANWFNLLQTIGIVVSILFTGFTLLRDTRSRNVSNLFAMKQEHRELWNLVHVSPELARVLEPNVDLVARPMTNQEEIFLRQMIVHFAVSWELMDNGARLDQNAFKKDAGEIFSLPLPKFALNRVRGAQPSDFLLFIDEAVRDSTSGKGSEA